MGENVLVGIAFSYWPWTLMLLGLSLLFFGLFLLLFCALVAWGTKTAAMGMIAILMGILSLIAIFPVWIFHYNPVYQNNEKTAEQQLKPIQEVYNSHRFYLKEQISEPGVWGEIKGSAGGFILFGGNIYGRIDSGRILTVVYEDDDALIDKYIHVHRSMSLPLDQVVIETINADERPYLMYPEAAIAKIGHRLELIPKTIHLYLPKGWKIL
ncbi:MAG: hypothetical protein AAB871_01235 [Patescibacteria group bacterium]